MAHYSVRAHRRLSARITAKNMPVLGKIAHEQNALDLLTFAIRPIIYRRMAKLAPPAATERQIGGPLERVAVGSRWRGQSQLAKISPARCRDLPAAPVSIRKHRARSSNPIQRAPRAKWPARTEGGAGNAAQRRGRGSATRKEETNNGWRCAASAVE